MTVREQLQAKYGAVAPSTPTVQSSGSIRAQLEAKYGVNQKTPSFGGQIVRGFAKPLARIATNAVNAGQVIRGEKVTQPFSGGYLGEVKAVGQSGNFAKDVLDSFGVGADIGSNLIGGGGATSVVKQGLKGAVKRGLVTGIKSGTAAGATYGLGSGLQEQEGKTTKQILGDTATNTLKGGATGLIAGGAFGVASPMVTRFIPKSPQVRSDKVDKQIRNIFRGTTGDINKLDTSAFKARKGLELLQKNSKEILIPDSNSPLGSNLVKPFDLQKSSPNELLSSVLEMDKKIVNIARKATEEAKNAGLKVDISSSEQIIQDAVKRGDIADATGKRLVRQIRNTENDPVKIHDWIQDVNVKYKKKYERGTIEDTSIGKIADDVAEDMRSKLDTLIDRKGYAEAFGNNQELKRMLIAIAKKANRKVNFGDITTDAGLDLGISVLTGNPAYMARTVGSGLFRGLVSRFRNTQGLRDFKSAAKGVKGLPTKTKLPSSDVKQSALVKKENDVAQQQVQSIQDKISKKENYAKEIEQLVQKANEENLGGMYARSGTFLKKALEIAKENDIDFPTNKVSERVRNSWENMRRLRPQELEIPQSKSAIAPKISQTPIKTKDIIPPKKLDNISAPKTTQKQVSSDIPKTVQLPKKKSSIPNRNAGFISTGGFKNTGNLTTKILKDLEGKTTVSKQYILDATNRGELKQVERDITRQVLDTMPDGQINVKEFADKVKSELLPLKVNKARDMYSTARGRTGGRYENIALPDELRGSVKNYEERIYESPIKTSAGQVHFGQPKDGVENYFGHTRIEDMADNKTRRVIEVQSDLYQKGNLEREMPYPYQAEAKSSSPEIARQKVMGDKGTGAKEMQKRVSEVAKLQQYNDPTAHFRMIREEIKKASQDGKTKLQFPTGETAMKIEGLSRPEQWSIMPESGIRSGNDILSPEKMKVGTEVYMTNNAGDNWIITDVLGDGKFKAVPKDRLDDLMENAGIASDTIEPTDAISYAERHITDFDRNMETFDISGKVDTNNPIYKFYEKDVQKYLNKFGGKKVVDDKGVSWIEVPITKEMGKQPVEAFGKSQPNVLMIGALGSAGVVGGLALNKKNKEKKQVNLPPKQVKKESITELKPRPDGTKVYKLASGTEVGNMHPKISESIKNTYNKYPELPKGILEALLMKESSAGYDDTNRNSNIGKYAWLGGLTKIAKKELERFGYKADYDTISGAIDSIAKFWSLKSKNKTPYETYRDEYSSGKLDEEDLKKFNEMFAYYSNK